MARLARSPWTHKACRNRLSRSRSSSASDFLAQSRKPATRLSTKSSPPRKLSPAVGQGGGRGLVDQALDLEVGELPGGAGRLALRVVEIGGHRDDRLPDLGAQKGLGVCLERAQHEGRELLGPELSAAHSKLARRTHVPFEDRGGLSGMGDQPLPRGHSHQDFASLVETDHRRREVVAKRVGYDLGAAILPDRDRTVGGTEVNADDHECQPVSRRTRSIACANSCRLITRLAPQRCHGQRS